MPLYEIAVYNQKVRDLLEDGNSHPHLDDDWADTHYIEIKADSEEAARQRMGVMRPPAMGYVIESIDEIE